MEQPGVRLLSKFKGAMAGAVFGDCLGAKFEHFWRELPYENVITYFEDVKQKVKSPKSTQEGFVLYTDDTLMTFDLGESLIKYKEFNPHDVARNFSETYFASTPQRFYGGNVASVFRKLKNTDYEGDPYIPASEQFNGSGSYGNGSSMRVTPVPLFHYNDIPNMVKLATQQSKLTHTNPKGIYGAILQTLAIQKAMTTKKIEDTKNFCDELMNRLEDVTEEGEHFEIYKEKLQNTIKLLSLDRDVNVEEFETIGSDVTAQQAVPAAIFSFLHTLDEKKIPVLSKYNGLVRAVIFASALSLDSDTVASMAGAIAGAYYGIESIPPEWLKACEEMERAIKLADDLYHIRFN